MTGLGFSPAAVEQARMLAAELGIATEFVVSDVYDAVEVLGLGSFDLVYTGIGALCWLHPMLWALSYTRPDHLLAVEHPYFETEVPQVWTEGGTYVQTDMQFVHNTSVEWNHGLGEIMTALIDRGMRITGLVEHDSVPWDALPGKMVKLDSGEYRLVDRPRSLAASYTLQAVKAGI